MCVLNCTRSLAPDVVSLAQELIVKVWIVSWGFFRVNKFEFVSTSQALFNKQRIKTHPRCMFHCCWPLVGVLLDVQLHFLLELPGDSLAVLHAHLDNLECVPKESTLDLLINDSIRRERWSMVYFEHPWPQLLVEHDVEAEEFKAAIRLLRLTAAVDVLQLRLHRGDGLNDYCLYLFPNLTSWPGRTRAALLDRRLSHDAFQAVIKAQLVCIVVKVIVLFIKRVVCEMGVWIVEILGRVILFGGKSD